jgi:hypothetical protein
MSAILRLVGSWYILMSPFCGWSWRHLIFRSTCFVLLELRHIVWADCYRRAVVLKSVDAILLRSHAILMVWKQISDPTHLTKLSSSASVDEEQSFFVRYSRSRDSSSSLPSPWIPSSPAQPSVSESSTSSCCGIFSLRTLHRLTSSPLALAFSAIINANQLKKRAARRSGGWAIQLLWFSLFSLAMLSLELRHVAQTW